MKLHLDSIRYIETTDFIDLSIPVAERGVRAWYLDAPKIFPVMENGFVGSVEDGGQVNFKNILFNPHGHGTHTESYGHITREKLPVSNCFTKFFYNALLVTVVPQKIGKDLVITPAQMAEVLAHRLTEALVIRTLPNGLEKREFNYSNTNPPYMDTACVALLDEAKVSHLLVDIPSVDKEVDGGVLAFHHAFWNVPIQPKADRTLTELIFVPDQAIDGEYLLELQLANFDNDASPSRPLLYPIKKEA